MSDSDSDGFTSYRRRKKRPGFSQIMARSSGFRGFAGSSGGQQFKIRNDPVTMNFPKAQLESDSDDDYIGDADFADDSAAGFNNMIQKVQKGLASGGKTGAPPAEGKDAAADKEKGIPDVSILVKPDHLLDKSGASSSSKDAETGTPQQPHGHYDNTSILNQLNQPVHARPRQMWRDEHQQAQLTGGHYMQQFQTPQGPYPAPQTVLRPSLAPPSYAAPQQQQQQQQPQNLYDSATQLASALENPFPANSEQHKTYHGILQQQQFQNLQLMNQFAQRDSNPQQQQEYQKLHLMQSKQHEKDLYEYKFRERYRQGVMPTLQQPQQYQQQQQLVFNPTQLPPQQPLEPASSSSAPAKEEILSDADIAAKFMSSHSEGRKLHSLWEITEGKLPVRTKDEIKAAWNPFADEWTTIFNNLPDQFNNDTNYKKMKAFAKKEFNDAVKSASKKRSSPTSSTSTTYIPPRSAMSEYEDENTTEEDTEKAASQPHKKRKHKKKVEITYSSSSSGSDSEPEEEVEPKKESSEDQMSRLRQLDKTLASFRMDKKGMTIQDKIARLNKLKTTLWDSSDNGIKIIPKIQIHTRRKHGFGDTKPGKHESYEKAKARIDKAISYWDKRL
jgi:hypothetical protein